MLIAKALRNGLFRDGTTLDDVVAAVLSRRDRQLCWQYPDYSLVSKIKGNCSGILVLDQVITSYQVQWTMKSLTALTGSLVSLQSHDIRRGAAKDILKLPKHLILATDAGSARALGHTVKAQEKHYNSEEDEPLNIHKLALPITRIDKKHKESSQEYHKPTSKHQVFLVNEWIQASRKSDTQPLRVQARLAGQFHISTP